MGIVWFRELDPGSSARIPIKCITDTTIIDHHAKRAQSHKTADGAHSRLTRFSACRFRVPAYHPVSAPKNHETAAIIEDEIHDNLQATVMIASCGKHRA
jgi:hypothetical protein